MGAWFAFWGPDFGPIRRGVRVLGSMVWALRKVAGGCDEMEICEPLLLGCVID